MQLEHFEGSTNESCVQESVKESRRRRTHVCFGRTPCCPVCENTRGDVVPCSPCSLEPEENTFNVVNRCRCRNNLRRCDDLESLGYVIVSMLNKSSSELPWSGSTSIKNGLDLKRKTSLETLCRDCPAGMLQYMKAVRVMTYEETPNYDQLDDMLQSMQQNDSEETAAAASATEPAGREGRNRGAAGPGAAAPGMAKRGRSEAEAVASSERPVKLRRSQRLSS